jgi:peroxiredoxin
MTLAINEPAPDFEAETTDGKIRFHDWIGDKWAVLFYASQGLHACHFRKFYPALGFASRRRIIA